MEDLNVDSIRAILFINSSMLWLIFFKDSVTYKYMDSSTVKRHNVQQHLKKGVHIFLQWKPLKNVQPFDREQ